MNCNRHSTQPRQPRQASYALALALIIILLALGGCASPAQLDRPPPAGFQGFYQPQPGQTLAQIAQGLPVNEAALRRFNPRSQETPLNPERRLRIPERNADAPPQGPYAYRIQPGDTLASLAQHFHLSLLSIIQANPGIEPRRLQIGQRIHLPVAGRDLNNYRWPTANPRIRIGYSQQRWGLHQGLALETQPREEIFPIAPGKVIFAGQMRGFGRVVILEHSDTRQSVYAYCHAIFVDEGSHLTGRHPLCAAGQQRQIDKPGIYFELREAGQAVPPENYLPALPWPQ